MSFDAFCAMAMARELNTALAGAKVERIFMPTRDSVILSMRVGGETKKLLFSASPSSARLSLTERNPENPKVPPSFCLQLRHHLSGALVRSVSTFGTERVIDVAFDAYDEMGFACRRSLVMEIMGGCSNVLFTGEKEGETRILGLLRPVDMTETGRLLIPGSRYTLPPKQQKADPLTETREHFLARLHDAGDKPCESFLLSSYIGFSPIVTREIACRAGALDVPCTQADGEAVFAAFRDVLDAHRRGDIRPTLVLRDSGEPFDFSFTDITQYGNTAKKQAFPTLSALLDAYYGEKEQAASIRARSHDIGTALKNAQKSLSRKLEAQQKELAETESMEQYRVWGDLLTSSLYLNKGKAPLAVVPDYYREELPTVRVPLEATLTAGQNAARYYKKYNKLKTARAVLTEQI
ncbi:MAG: NFACT family protein [Ruminococcus sp.]|nr:NFACT family protein [Candidatus Apopatosoma intestinale]